MSTEHTFWWNQKHFNCNSLNNLSIWEDIWKKLMKLSNEKLTKKKLNRWPLVKRHERKKGFCKLRWVIQSSYWVISLSNMAFDQMKRNRQRSNIENTTDDFASIKARNLKYCCGIRKIFEFDVSWRLIHFKTFSNQLTLQEKITIYINVKWNNFPFT